MQLIPRKPAPVENATTAPVRGPGWVDPPEPPSGEEFTAVLVSAPAKRALSDISPKVSGGALAGAVAVIVTFVAGQVGLDIPPTVEAAVAILVTVAAGYLIPDNR